jgi:hypothetical protein
MFSPGAGWSGYTGWNKSLSAFAESTALDQFPNESCSDFGYVSIRQRGYEPSFQFGKKPFPDGNQPETPPDRYCASPLVGPVEQAIEFS